MNSIVLTVNITFKNSDDAPEYYQPISSLDLSNVTEKSKEDENRRNVPLTTENAMRVMEAMRGVSFAGVVPDWAG
ncbi:hypothetical protein JHK82_031569 [Glycine max]|nr:hypothetical protein JHK85_032222 [Glycine max]KAG5124832.1 hypothetical protein JHK82_031569 [Glycine max]